MGRNTIEVDGGQLPADTHVGAVRTIDSIQMLLQPHTDGHVLTPGVSWCLSADDLRDDSEYCPGWMSCTVLGSLVVMSEHWGVYVTSRLVYVFPDGRVSPDSAPVTSSDLLGMIQGAAPWSAQLLWQQAALSARTLVALCAPAHRDRLCIPEEMPTAVFTVENELLERAAQSVLD